MHPPKIREEKEHLGAFRLGQTSCSVVMYLAFTCSSEGCRPELPLSHSLFTSSLCSRPEPRSRVHSLRAVCGIVPELLKVPSTSDVNVSSVRTVSEFLLLYRKSHGSNMTRILQRRRAAVLFPGT